MLHALSEERGVGVVWSLALLLCACPQAGSEPPPPMSTPAAITPLREEPTLRPAWSSTWPSGAALLEAWIPPKPQSIPSVEDAWWAGRRGDPGTLERLLGRIRGMERPSTAWIVALGLVREPAFADPERWAEAENVAWARYATQTDPATLEAWLWVLARHGGTASEQRLAAELAVVPGTLEVTHASAAWQALGVLCSRGIPLSADGLWAVHLGLLSGPELRQPAAYALGRCASLSAELLAGADRAAWVGALAVLLDDAPQAQALAWRAFSGLGELPPSIPASVLLEPGEEPEAWMTEVEAVRALAAHRDGQERLLERLVRAPGSFEGPRVHVLLEALRRLAPRMHDHPHWVTALEPLENAWRGRSGAAANWIVCELALLRSIANGQTDVLAHCGDVAVDLPATWREERVVEALYHTRHRKEVGGTTHPVHRLVAYARDPRPAVAQVALSALADVDDPQVNTALRQGLQAEDPGIRTAAAAAVAMRAERLGRLDRDARPILETLAATEDIALLEARLLAIRALGRLARAEAPSRTEAPAWLQAALMPLAQDPHRAILREAHAALGLDLGVQGEFVRAMEAHAEPMPSGPPAAGELPSGLEFLLERGSFVVHFTGITAPVAQTRFTALASAGFFDGTRIHRVVPGFVVQGGDPRGDGYGGPGFVLPDETSSLQFRRGTVGVASAGPDTGGSQFFVTLTDQPHLDGRFTVIGWVDSEEMQHVDAILPLDKVVSVRPWENAP